MDIHFFRALGRIRRRSHAAQRVFLAKSERGQDASFECRDRLPPPPAASCRSDVLPSCSPSRLPSPQHAGRCDRRSKHFPVLPAPRRSNRPTPRGEPVYSPARRPTPASARLDTPDISCPLQTAGDVGDKCAVPDTRPPIVSCVRPWEIASHLRIEERELEAGGLS